MKKYICLFSILIIFASASIGCSNTISSSSKIINMPSVNQTTSNNSFISKSVSSSNNIIYHQKNSNTTVSFSTSTPENLLYLSPQYFPTKEPTPYTIAILEGAFFDEPYITNVTSEEL